MCIQKKESKRAVELLHETLNTKSYLTSFIPAADDEINLMTLHKSKGLEFNIVFHMDLYKWIALLTYVVTLNMELAFFTPQYPWISNNFILTVCGGVFTSTLVVLLCEVQKYLGNKANCEQYLFYQTMYLYSIIFQMQKNVEEYIANEEEVVPEGLLEKSAQMAQYQVNTIRNIDYVTFCKKNPLVIAHRNFCTKKLAEITRTTR